MLCNLSVEYVLLKERCPLNHCGFSPSPAQTCQIGLNFASEEEAKRFRAAINDLLNRRQRKTGKFFCFSLSSLFASSTCVTFHLSRLETEEH